MLARSCQIGTLYEEISCSQKAVGFLLKTDESPTAV